MSWKKVELIEGEPVVFVGVYALRWRAEWGEPSVGFVPDDDSEVNALSARLAIAVEALDNLTGLISTLKKHLSSDGEYSISRTDKENMCMGEVLMLGDLLEKIDAIVAKAALEKISETQKELKDTSDTEKAGDK